MVSNNNIAPEFFNIPEMQGVYGSAPAIHNPGFIFAQEVAEEYETRFGKKLDFAGAVGHHVASIFVGLLQDEELSRENLKRILDQGFTYSGVFGTVDVLKGGHDLSFPLYPTQIVDGKIEYLQ